MGGMPFPMPGGRGGAAAGGLGLIAVLVVVLLQTCAGGGGAAFNLPAGFDGTVQAPGQPTGIPASEDPDRDLRDFSTYVFTDAQETWTATFQRDGQPYENAQLVYYTGGVNTACGGASSAVGPFYCPGDQRVYLDLSFYRQMQQQLGAGGDFAWAYVIAHEMGHHVQQQTGTSEEVRNLQRQNPDQANQLSVRQELQADCYAGVWANTVFQEGALQEGDLEEAFTASEAVGDDRIQSSRGGSINPDSFTHGTSEQRRSWFNRGYESGEAGACDTYSPDEV
jgi:predicted metalloprotease